MCKELLGSQANEFALQASLTQKNARSAWAFFRFYSDFCSELFIVLLGSALGGEAVVTCTVFEECWPQTSAAEWRKT